MNDAVARPVHILIVEDSAGDVRLTREFLREAGVATELSVVHDGVEALEFLHCRGAYAAVRRPDLILLDLNLPRKPGRELLADIKADPQLRRIPVLVLTTSRAEQDVLASYDLHANCYITKPPDLDRFIDVIRAIEQFWLRTVRLPGREEP